MRVPEEWLPPPQEVQKPAYNPAGLYEETGDRSQETECARDLKETEPHSPRLPWPRGVERFPGLIHTQAEDPVRRFIKNYFADPIAR